MRSNPNNDQKKLLIAELKKAAIKHTPENILRITKDREHLIYASE
jgi:hypothetical protein